MFIIFLSGSVQADLLGIDHVCGNTNVTRALTAKASFLTVTKALKTCQKTGGKYYILTEQMIADHCYISAPLQDNKKFYHNPVAICPDSDNSLKLVISLEFEASNRYRLY